MFHGIVRVANNGADQLCSKYKLSVRCLATNYQTEIINLKMVPSMLSPSYSLLGCVFILPSTRIESLSLSTYVLSARTSILVQF